MKNTVQHPNFRTAILVYFQAPTNGPPFGCPPCNPIRGRRWRLFPPTIRPFGRVKPVCSPPSIRRCSAYRNFGEVQKR